MAEDNPSAADPQEQGAGSGEGSENVDEGQEGSSGETQQDDNSLTLEELNQHLGKNFKDRESALKSLKDTQNYVGKVGQQDVDDAKKQAAQAQQGTEEKAQLEQKVEQLERDRFFDKHPEFSEYRQTIESMASRMNDTLENVVQSEELKPIWEKVQKADELQQSKSVLQSNPRLGQATDSMKQAREAQSKGDHAGAKKSAIRGVLHAYES